MVAMHVMKALGLLAVLGLLAPGIANAQKLYKYRDETGAWVYSYKKPPDAPAEEVRLLGVAPPEKAAQEKLEKDKAALDERREERTAAAATSSAQQEREAILKRNCEVAKENLRVLESGSRVVETDKQGNPYFLDEEQTKAKTEQARKQIEEYC